MIVFLWFVAMLHPKLTPAGFNNITRSLCASLYYIGYAETGAAQRKFLSALNTQFAAAKLEQLLRDLCRKLGADIVASSKRAYVPMGASASALIAEGAPQHLGQLYHLDKSHLAAHTYPEASQTLSHASFRVDLDLSTCGDVTPLNVLTDLLRTLQPDVFTFDLRLRGFTRDVNGKRWFTDGMELNSQPLSAALDAERLACYQLSETTLMAKRVFLLKGMRKWVQCPAEGPARTEMAQSDEFTETWMAGSWRGLAMLNEKQRLRAERVLAAEQALLYREVC